MLIDKDILVNMEKQKFRQKSKYIAFAEHKLNMARLSFTGQKIL